MADELWVAQLGPVPYVEALELQSAAARAAPGAARSRTSLLLLEHPPVYTRGRRTEPGDLPMGEDWYRAQGIEVARHRPRRPRDLPRPGPARGLPDHGIERRRRRTCTRWSRRSSRRSPTRAIAAEVRDGLTGVWAGDAQDRLDRRARVARRDHARLRGERGQRPAAVRVDRAVRDRRRADDLACSRETGRTGGMRCFRKRVAWRFAQAFGLRQRIVSPRRGCSSAGRVRRCRHEHALARQPGRRPVLEHGRRAPLPRAQAGRGSR